MLEASSLGSPLIGRTAERVGTTRGILPITKSTFEVSAGFHGVFGGWELPGHGDPYAGCGAFFYRGCLDVEAHKQERLDVEASGRIYVKRIASTCLRAVCPVCYEKWAAKEAHKIEYRIDQVRGLGPPVHVVVSVPKSDYGLVLDDFVKLRRKVYLVVKRVGIRGGSMIFHPFRQNPLTKEWFFSPHFHLIGFGWVLGVDIEFELSGYVIKNKGIRDSVFATAMYQLSHCGINSSKGKRGFHSVTWFGACSYNKLNVEPEIVEPEVCPLCGKKLGRILFVGDADPLEGEPEGEYFLELGEWVPWRGYG
jgi:hypothetical protein